MKSLLDTEHQNMFSMFNSVIFDGYQANSVVKTIAADLVQFAAHLLNAQAAQIAHYDCSNNGVDQDGNDQYCVTRQLFGERPAGEFNKVQTSNSLDYGVNTVSTYRTHLTTFKNCSCQFPSCWRLPCRHMLRLLLHVGSTNVTQQVVADLRSVVSADILQKSFCNCCCVLTLVHFLSRRSRPSGFNKRHLL